MSVARAIAKPGSGSGPAADDPDRRPLLLAALRLGAVDRPLGPQPGDEAAQLGQLVRPRRGLQPLLDPLERRRRRRATLLLGTREVRSFDRMADVSDRTRRRRSTTVTTPTSTRRVSATIASER